MRDVSELETLEPAYTVTDVCRECQNVSDSLKIGKTSQNNWFLEVKTKKTKENYCR